tara:strand:+ start:26 stop:493 length:468 start_codon:yes stop_codon:yes gene_type:complete
MKKIIIIFSFFLLLSCGFEPIYSKKKLEQNYNFTISNIGFSGDTSVNKNIKNNLINYIDNPEKPIKYDLIISSLVNKTITSKSLKGDPEIFYIEITIILEVLENDNLKNKITFKEAFEYKNKSNKYELKKYEKNIQKNLSLKISKDIIEYLYSIK